LKSVSFVSSPFRIQFFKRFPNLIADAFRVLGVRAARLAVFQVADN
jgi:hypothetical protein